MLEIPSLRPESRYGMPGADQLLFNRQYVVGYSYLLRQAAWAMEVIDPFNRRVEVKRDDSFRSDLRVPEFFRAELADYVNSDHDRGHLIASADKRSNRVRNSETFLLSNMTPQKPQFNQGIWRKLEEAVRELSHLYIETYVTCGPLFDVGKPIEVIGRNSDDENDVVVPIPHAYFKSILAENARGKLRLWSFMLKNEASSVDIASFLCKTVDIERQGGLVLWDRLHGEKADEFKRHKGRMWDVTKAREAALLAQQERALNRLN